MRRRQYSAAVHNKKRIKDPRDMESNRVERQNLETENNNRQYTSQFTTSGYLNLSKQNKKTSYQFIHNCCIIKDGRLPPIGHMSFG